MAKSFQHQKPPSRVDLTLDVATGDAQEKVELPLRLLVMSDLTGEKEDTPLGDRDVVSINDNNFEDVMESLPENAAVFELQVKREVLIRSR